MKLLVIGTFPNPPPSRYKWNFRNKLNHYDPDVVLVSNAYPFRLYMEFVSPLYDKGKKIYSIIHDDKRIQEIDGEHYNEGAFDLGPTWFVFKEFNEELTYENVMAFLSKSR